MIYLSKSKYCALWQCPKLAWLRKFKPEEGAPDDSVLARMETGRQVGELAKGLFGSYRDVTAYRGEELDLATMLAQTQAELAAGTPVICEASFSYHGLYCAVDLLRKEADGWAIYEVKSASDREDRAFEKAVYLADIAYQKYVLESCGVRVTGTYLVCINHNYIRNGAPEPKQLFVIRDVSRQVADESERLSAILPETEKLLDDPNEPDVDLSVSCREPYPCAYWSYCAKHLPEPSVFDLYRLPFKKKIALYKQGCVSFPDVRSKARLTNATQLRQVEYALEDKGTYVDKDGVRAFLKTLSYPLYFLDFETMQPVIPEYDGTRPYMQIPFQYSLHCIERPGGELKHKEFLADPCSDPRRPLAERLCADIPKDVCATAYNKAFECTRIRELAALFPDLAEHLLCIAANIVDLITPFRAGHYYNRAMGGSFSIKSVLPAIYPDDPKLDYHNLEGVHNGGEAMTIFPKLRDMPPDARETARRNLLKYCELDTYAMVKVWQELVRAAE